MERVIEVPSFKRSQILRLLEEFVPPYSLGVVVSVSVAQGKETDEPMKWTLKVMNQEIPVQCHFDAFSDLQKGQAKVTIDLPTVKLTIPKDHAALSILNKCGDLSYFGSKMEVKSGDTLVQLNLDVLEGQALFEELFSAHGDLEYAVVS